ncbi:MAG: plasmid recombination protein [Gammaproteobacteria bacterium]|nr:plasmid recombination protein [Gammaproteobacteria bacterium]
MKAILRVAKLKSMGEIAGSLAHTFRDRETLNADPDKTPDNEHSSIDAKTVKQAILHRLPSKLRKDNVLVIEHLITASPEYFTSNDGSIYFDTTKKWLAERYGEENVISTHIHRDETSPHLIAYVVPLDSATGKLNAKKWLGGKAKLSEMQTEFASYVEHLQLERGLKRSNARHTTIREYYAHVNAIERPNTPVIILPARKLFESDTSYTGRAEESALDQIKPQLEQMASVIKDLQIKVEHKDSEIQRTNSQLNILRKSTETYTRVMNGLTYNEGMTVHQAMNHQRNEIIKERRRKEYEQEKEKNRLEEEARRKAQDEANQKIRDSNQQYAEIQDTHLMNVLPPQPNISEEVKKETRPSTQKQSKRKMR